MKAPKDVREATERSLRRMQEFDADSLAREEELGKAYNFRGAVQPAKELIQLYQRMSVLALDDFPPEQLNIVQAAANRDYAAFERILKLDTTQGIASSTRESYIEAIRQAYAPTFRELSPLISYSLHRSADFQQLNRDALAALQRIRDMGEEFRTEFAETKKEAQETLDKVREAAAEQGVTQQSIHFRDAAKEHGDEAKHWQKQTMGWAIALGAYAIVSLFLHKLPFLAPATAYDTVQLSISKVLIFTVISYMLYMSARNFVAHRHNAIVNKHRQNALMTYEAIAAAAKNQPNQDVILTHASACIFSPQPTGYSGNGAHDSGGPKSIVEVFARHGAGE